MRTGPLSTLLRLLFPSWAFFDTARSSPVLEIRHAGSLSKSRAWQQALIAPPRRPWHLLFNPAGTQVLLYQTQVERFYLSVANGETQHEEHGTSSSVVRAIAESAVPPEWRAQGSLGWQYRVAVIEHPATSHLPTTIFESAVFE